MAGDAQTDRSGAELTADLVRAWLEAKRRRDAEDARHRQRTEQAEQDRMRRHFMERDVPDDALNHVAALVRRAAEAGEHRAMVLRFPAAWLPDRGRAIRARAPDWHTQLDGFARRAFTFWERALRPRGFGLQAVFLGGADGMPGEVGFFLHWNGSDEE